MVYPNVSRSIQLYLTVYVCIWLSSGSNCIQMYPQISLCIEVFPEDEMYPDVSRCIFLSSADVHMYPNVSRHLGRFTSIQVYPVVFSCIGTFIFFFCVKKKSGTCLKNLEFLFSSEKVSKYQENLGLV